MAEGRVEFMSYLSQPAEVVAPLLLGCVMEREVGNGQKMVGKIVEVEAYDQSDAASHSYRGQTARTEVMFGPAGRLYVYFTYGMHYCCNVVCGPVGRGSAVLIRGVEPISGLELMRYNREGAHGDNNLTNGPAKFAQAFMVDKSLNGHYLQDAPLKLILMPSLNQADIIQTTRIGITRDADRPWRWFVRDNPFVSRNSVE